jgi:hypothetical protein
MPNKEPVRNVAARRYWREAEARVVLDSWRRSGERLGEFCRGLGVEARRVARWAGRIERESGPSARVRFHPVHLVAGDRAPARAPAIEIDLSGGWRVRVAAGFAAEDLRRVLAVLDERSAC